MDAKKEIIKKEDVEYLGNLARISLTDEEKQQFAKELGKIIYYVSQLSEVAADKISPVWHVLPVTNVFRHDRVENSSGTEDILSNAPERADNFFKVPRII